MAITYAAGITTVTGYTEGTPCNFTDIYNADVAGGWGVWAKNGSQFNTSSALKVGDGTTTTWLADEAKQVEFTGADIPKAGESVDFDWKILLKANSNFRLGKVEDATDKTTSNGCQIIFNLTGHAGFGTCLNSPPSTAKLELYSTTIVSIPAYIIFIYGTDGAKMHNCIFTDYVNPIRCKNTDIYNINVENGLYGLSEIAGTIDNVFVTHCGDGATMGGVAIADSIIKNSVFVNNTKLLYMSSPAYDVYMVNCTADAWTIRHAAAHSKKLYRQYELDLKVTDKDDVAINAATVKIWDKDSNLVVDTTTNASGVITAQTITRGHYDYANGDTLQEKSPHLIKIEKSGTDYLTYEKDFTLNHETDWEVTMVNMTDLRNDIAALDTKIDAVQTDLDNPNQYKADVPTAVENAIAVWDRILTGATHNIATSAGRRVRETGAYAIDGGTAQGGNGFSITLAATASGDDGVYNRNLIVLTDNTGAGQTRTIVDYDAATKVCVVDREWRVSPDATTTYQVVPDDTPLTVDHGRARGGTSTTITLRTYASSVDDTYLCNQIGIIAGPGRGQSRLVGAYNGTTKVVTICGDPWVTTPTTDSIYVMMPYGTTCVSCVGDHALEQIKSEVDVMKLLPFAV